ncbi:hypothetical protein BGX38DRAFT_1158337 [Terfezia claveryi]|nr:hypothetical protein BGX38DRAFT_1158337 [Terfezia claveryi]
MACFIDDYIIRPLQGTIWDKANVRNKSQLPLLWSTSTVNPLAPDNPPPYITVRIMNKAPMRSLVYNYHTVGRKHRPTSWICCMGQSNFACTNLFRPNRAILVQQRPREATSSGAETNVLETFWYSSSSLLRSQQPQPPSAHGQPLGTPYHVRLPYSWT